VNDRRGPRKRWRPKGSARSSSGAGTPPRASPHNTTDGPAPAEPGPATTGAAVIDAKVVATVATALWRMRNKMVTPGSDRPPPELRAPFRHLESAWDALTDAGIEVQSHDGLASDPGLALSVVAYQPTAGLDCDRVIETIRPSVYLHGRPIQHGEVVVGTPIDSEEAPK
jgi:hypothetical protein